MTKLSLKMISKIDVLLHLLVGLNFKSVISIYMT